MDELYAIYTEQERVIRRRIREAKAAEDIPRVETLMWYLGNVSYAQKKMRHWIEDKSR